MDLLQDWPEPIVPVQSIADSGLTLIPDRYVKPSSERPSLNSITGSVSQELSIPVVDLNGLNGGEMECRATMRSVSDACRDWGFFQVVNHGVSMALISKMRVVWRNFFEMPMEEKKQLANSPMTYEGYGSRLGVEKGACLDWGDYFFLHVLPESIKNYDKWPAQPTCCREITDEYGRALAKLCKTLMKVMSISLGLDARFLHRAFGEEEVGACLRVNYYPKCPQPDLALGLSAHSDPGGLTVLLADDHVKGLQVRKGSEWVTIQPIPNAFIVNVGDQIQVLSNAVYKSVEHRVVSNAAQERYSFAFFYNPRSDLPLCPAAELIAPERPQLYQPMTFNEYRFYIRKKGLKGKAQVESLKSM